LVINFSDFLAHDRNLYYTIIKTLKV